MNIDIAILNPPYGTLALPFLEKVIEISGTAVSIQPCTWMQDPSVYRRESAKRFKKYEDSIARHIIDFEEISCFEINRKFGIDTKSNLAIYVCDKDGGYDYKSIATNEVIEKVLDYIYENFVNIDLNKNDGWRMRIPQITGGRSGGSGNRAPVLADLYIADNVYYNGKKDGKWWYEFYAKNSFSKRTETITASIKFNSEQEGHNFWKSSQTDFGRYISHHLIVGPNTHVYDVLWMGNAIHPRTGTKGYIDEWTNEDFYKFFEVNEKWQKIIEEFIREFEERRARWFAENRNTSE